MQKQIPIKNHAHEIQLIGRRSMFALLMIILLTGCLVMRLAYLQIHKNDLYTTLSTQNAIDVVPLEPTRGLIYDRNGILLAENIPVFSLDIVPQQVHHLATTLENLKNLLTISENDIAQFRKQLKQHRRFDEIPLKLRLSAEEVARFAENQYRFPGVRVKARLMRFYPYGKSFSHVLGYVGRINAQELSRINASNYSASHYIGKLGIEKFYENDLHGKVGYEEVESDATGKPIRILKKTEGKPGKNIKLTIDSGLQFVAEKALENHQGAVVAIDPQTGEVLAMVSEPSYDPNFFVTGISQHDYNELQQAENKPLFDRSLRGVYPMGSTIKPYLALGSLERELINPDLTIMDNGTFTLPNSTHVFHDYTRKGHGKVNLARAITTSSNVYFFHLATRIGIQTMDDILLEFGFGKPTGIDLEGELAGIVASPEWKLRLRGSSWYPGDTIISSIGQGFMQATPLQMAVAVATIATRGIRHQPILVSGEQLPGKNFTKVPPISLPPIEMKDARHWDLIIKAMQEVITTWEGSARAAFGTHYTYTVAGKTGTAALSRRRNPNERDRQENLPEKLRDHHLFVAFAPIENPQIAVAVVTEHSSYAIKTTRALLDYYLGEKHASSNPQIPYATNANALPVPAH